MKKIDNSAHDVTDATLNETQIAAEDTIESTFDGQGRQRIPKSFWSRSILEKESYPYDVNGDVIKKLPKGALLQDQWNWSKQMKCTLAKLYIDGKKFIGSSHSQNCKGSFFCSKTTCSFRRETGNVTSSLPSQADRCNYCKQVMSHMQCFARRYIGRSSNYVVVAHYRLHDCSPTKKFHLKKLSKEDI